MAKNRVGKGWPAKILLKFLLVVIGGWRLKSAKMANLSCQVYDKFLAIFGRPILEFF